MCKGLAIKTDGKSIETLWTKDHKEIRKGREGYEWLSLELITTDEEQPIKLNVDSDALTEKEEWHKQGLLEKDGTLPEYIEKLVWGWFKEHELEVWKSLARIGAIGRETGGDCDNSYQKVKGDCYNSYQEVEGDCCNSYQKVKGDCYNSHQKVKGDCYNSYQEVEGDCYNSHQKVKGDCYNSYQEVKGEIFLDYVRNSDAKVDKFIKKLSDAEVKKDERLTWKKLVRLAMKK